MIKDNKYLDRCSIKVLNYISNNPSGFEKWLGGSV
jgi:hypothetical protein